MSFRFWQGWLQCVCAGSAAFGAVLVLAPDSALLEGYNRHTLEAFFPGSRGGASLSSTVVNHHHWALAVMGSATAGWAILLLWVATGPFGRRERWAWQAIAVSVLVWAVGDSIVSWRAGVYLEVLWNAIVVALIALPLARTHGAMESSAAER